MISNVTLLSGRPVKPRLETWPALDWTRIEDAAVGPTKDLGVRLPIPAHSDANTVYMADATDTPAGSDANAGTQAAPKLTLFGASGAVARCTTLGFTQIGIQSDGTFIGSGSLAGCSVFALEGYAPTITPDVGFAQYPTGQDASATVDLGTACVAVGSALVVAYIDANEDILCKYTTGGGAFASTSTSGSGFVLSAGTANFDRLVIGVDTSSRVVIAARVKTTNSMRVFRMSGAPGAGTWVDLGTPYASGVGSRLLLALNDNGYPYVNHAGNSTAYQWIAGTSWTAYTAVGMAVDAIDKDAAGNRYQIGDEKVFKNGSPICSTVRAQEAADICTIACRVVVGGVEQIAIVVAQPTRLLGYLVTLSGGVTSLGALPCLPNTTGNFPIAPISGGFRVAWINDSDKLVATASWSGAWGAVEYGPAVRNAAAALATIGNAGTAVSICQTSKTIIAAAAGSKQLALVKNGGAINGIAFVGVAGKRMFDAEDFPNGEIANCSFSGYDYGPIADDGDDGTPQILNCTFDGMATGAGLNSVSGSAGEAKIANCLFVDCPESVHAVQAEADRLENCTFIRSAYPVGTGVPDGYRAAPRGCIFHDCGSFDGSTDHEYCLYSGTTPAVAGTGNVVSNALFVGPEDFTLRDKARGYYSDSPAVGLASDGSDAGCYPVTRTGVRPAGEVWVNPAGCTSFSEGDALAGLATVEDQSGFLSAAFTGAARSFVLNFPAGENASGRETFEGLRRFRRMANQVFLFGFGEADGWKARWSGAGTVSTKTLTLAEALPTGQLDGWYLSIGSHAYLVVSQVGVVVTLDEAPGDGAVDWAAVCLPVKIDPRTALEYKPPLPTWAENWDAYGQGYSLALREDSLAD